MHREIYWSTTILGFPKTQKLLLHMYEWNFICIWQYEERGSKRSYSEGTLKMILEYYMLTSIIHIWSLLSCMKMVSQTLSGFVILDCL